MSKVALLIIISILIMRRLEIQAEPIHYILIGVICLVYIGARALSAYEESLKNEH